MIREPASHDVARPAARRAYSASVTCVAVLRLIGETQDAERIGAVAGAARARWKSALRDEDTVTVMGRDVIVRLTGCPTVEAVAVIQRLRLVTPRSTWSTGLASWDHREAESVLLGRALCAARRAEDRPGSIVMARGDE